MNILVVNDDGYQAEGIKILVDGLREYGNIYVVSPETQQSAASHCITVHTYVRLYERDIYGSDVKAWSIEGTPADCVIFALRYLKLDVDIVFSGINDGPNLGTDTLYSGTLAGATEGIVQDKPAIALSSDFNGFDLAKKELDGVLELIFKDKLYSKDYVLNINFPKNEFGTAKGIKITEQGTRHFDHDFEEIEGKIWAKGWWGSAVNEPHTDVYAYENGYISLCPMGISRVDARGIRRLKRALGKQD